MESARRLMNPTACLRETEQRTSELAVINRVQKGLFAEMDMQAIYELVGRKDQGNLQCAGN